MFRNQTVIALIFFFSLALHSIVIPMETLGATNNSKQKESVDKQRAVVTCTVLETRSGESLAAMTTQEGISLPKTEGINALTVGEIYTNRLKLNGKTVQLRGKVVKYNPNIMGKNWLHIQDGTGSALDNSHDLVVTTTEVPTNMSDITLKGTLAADKDFGSGYRYSVIIEDATIIK